MVESEGTSIRRDYVCAGPRPLKGVDAALGSTRTETYENQAKMLFIKQPANMKLLVVADNCSLALMCLRARISISTSRCRTTDSFRPTFNSSQSKR